MIKSVHCQKNIFPENHCVSLVLLYACDLPNEECNAIYDSQCDDDDDDYYNFIFSRLPWVTVRHEYIGQKAYQIPHSTAVRDIKQLIYEETDLPVIEQQLVHNGKVVGKKQFYKL